MILQALYDYYQRRCAEPDPGRRLPAYGLERKEIAFILELDVYGRLTGISDVRQPVGKRMIGTAYLVPQAVKKTSGIAANLLWDTAEYVLGIATTSKLESARQSGSEQEYLDRLVAMRRAFGARIEALPVSAQSDAGILAIRHFLDADPTQAAEQLPAYAELADLNPVVSFRLAGDATLVCQRPGVFAHLGKASPHDDDAPASTTTCLVTGTRMPAERLHAAIKGVWGAQTSGANVVSFNLDAFNSHGKAQGENAPISPAAAFAYTTALNALLARNSPQRMQVGDASTVFWAQREDPLEGDLAEIFGGDDPDRHTEKVRALYASIEHGGFDGARGENPFFVLGLAPNAARIAVRFWHAGTLREIAQRVATWYDDLYLHGSPSDPRYPGLFRLLTSVSLQGKADNIPPRLGGDIVRCILSGTPFPRLWLQAAVIRCRAEREVTYMRAASIIACLRRLDRAASASQQNVTEMLPMLDTDNPSIAYRLGRLFAALERIQESANPGLNATIRERYYGGASSSPVSVFTTLMRLKNHHIAKLPNPGQEIYFERLIGEILSGIDEFPSHLSMPEQGRFAIGYYHQRQQFFTRRATETTEVSAADAASLSV